MNKTVRLEKFLREHDGDYSQFTIDWIEEALDEIEDWQQRKPLSEPDFLHAMSYDVGNIVKIMRPELSDVRLFKDLAALLTRLAKAADSTTRWTRMAERSGLN